MDMAEIEREIRKVEADRTSWNNCERLAVLYTVRDHQPEPRPVEYSYAPAASVEHYGDSEFLNAVEGVELMPLFRILDEHMSAVAVVFPKEYAAVLRKIRELNDF